MGQASRKRLYEVRNTPWYARDLNWGDVVRCEGFSPAGVPIVRERTRAGGHRTLRIFFSDASGEPQRQSLLDDVARFGATYECGHERFYSLDLEPDVDGEPILDLLSVAEEDGLLAWETGWT